MKILAAALSAAIAIAVLSGCAYDRYGNERNAIGNGQNDTSSENRDLPAKVYDLIGRP